MLSKCIWQTAAVVPSCVVVVLQGRRLESAKCGPLGLLPEAQVSESPTDETVQHPSRTSIHQNMPLLRAISLGISCTTSQCSTIFPPSTRKRS